MSDSKARPTTGNVTLRTERDQARMQVVRLLAYVLDMKEDYPTLPWRELPDEYDPVTWRYAA